MSQKFASFSEFYPFYLSEHSNRACRRLHFVGSSFSLACLLMALIQHNAYFVLGAVVCGYAFAWVGHFVFEKNKPATFKHPFFSLMGDWVMYMDIVTGKIPF
jgi:hypothetical protein